MFNCFNWAQLIKNDKFTDEVIKNMSSKTSSKEFAMSFHYYYRDHKFNKIYAVFAALKKRENLLLNIATYFNDIASSWGLKKIQLNSSCHNGSLLY